MSGQLSYPIYQPLYIEGQRQGGQTHIAYSYVNPFLAQIGTLTVGGTATAGAYTVTFAQAADPSFTPITVSFTRAAETNAQIGAALNTAINASSALLGVVSSSDGGAGVLTLTFKSTGIVWTVTTTAPAPGTLVWASTQAAGGANVRVGSWARHTAAASGADILVPITTAATIAEMVGIVERTYSAINSPNSAFDFYGPGTAVSCGQHGLWAMKVWEAVTEFSAPAIWIDPSDATAFAGQMGTTVTGGKSIDASSKCRYITRASAGGLALVQVTFGA